MVMTISSDDLARVHGGGAKWDAYKKKMHAKVAPDYKEVVCAGAGVEGGPIFAKEAYGADRATQRDWIRGGIAVRETCRSGGPDHLPAKAPPLPF